MHDLERNLITELAELKRMRDELRLEAHLARAEAKDLWVRLENAWPRVEARLREFGRPTEESPEHLARATRELLTELRDGYRSLRERH
jgi:hypothetical protein